MMCYRDTTHTNKTINLIEIPWGVRFNLGKYFILNTGFMLDFDIGKENELEDQSGIGCNLGLGVKYQAESRIRFSVSTYFKGYSVVLF